MAEWQIYFVCECGNRERLPFMSAFFARGCCPKCGSTGEGRGEIQISRWVSTAQLLKPWTWFTGHWETRDE